MTKQSRTTDRKMSRMRRPASRFRSFVTFLATFVIVTAFICLQNTRTFVDDAEQSASARQLHADYYIRDTRRSLLKFSSRRKQLKDALWTVRTKFKNETKLQRITINHEREIIAMEITNKLLNKHLPVGKATNSETTPSVTDAPTRPVTTQSDTTPIITDVPTSPVTTESITTPIVTEPGAKEVTTEKD
ncbi:uncharacterized protein LOC123553571 [Mercenaria mercenaria]|uniref:uncharacterized protein LOC123553571 n=1 Tax=Mercenaria mercenaria TaxID=6596 RepID=UPI001E1DC591|nr:uncharacterized protein LOC123553571 [Mercenaria mercenaria]